MIAELGLAALWLAAALAALQMAAGFLALRDAADGALAGLIRPAAIVQGVLVTLSFAMLVWLFAVTDLSVKLVASNSHSMKPLVFKLSGTWGNHEGSMLLWVMVMGLAGALIALVERRLPERTMNATLAAQGVVSLGFYAFLLLSSNPFERLPVPATEGMGLNPLLQDIGLAFHPPTLYLGYVGLSVAFSFAVGALLTRQVTPDFARAMRPWVLGAWVLLTIGITAGSYWAYYELGWGGWWFWDPVENASLMPWLAATALLHSASVLASRDALRTWTIMLGVVAFSMSMVGTFLVRSGILTSVHAFAVDPERGTFILVLLGIFIGGALLLFALRANTISEGERFALASREGALVFNNVMLSAILAIVLLGTLYPLLTEAFDVRVSVGPPYFNPVGAIFTIPMLVVMAVGPLLRWRQDRIDRIGKEIALFAALVLAALILTSLLADIALLPLLGLALGVGLAVASLMPLRGRKLARTPLATWGMVTAHFGIAVALIGMASESAFTSERLAAVEEGGSTSVGPWTVVLQGVEPVAGPNWTAIQGRVSASYDGGEPVVLTPQSRNFWAPPQQTTESALVTRWNGQLYAVVGDRSPDGRWQLRLWWKPFVTLIWYGGLLIALGGVLALVGRVLSDLRHRRLAARIADRRADREALA
ncbi:heme lyase CcmF/NrfE family subunit [Qipengyuania flava]|uniref:heme lyase CcmF/NrfE family subunit n=1 Tax=Qipengyuania flava TaxID=192812 RepID=UPI001C56F0E7|nr:heme lyase CcmF/NrfE family subunit [Qipengyuania flava]MBW3167934.1 heme lyase CcmF/NrfE family subunit [Qipengyuania flava]MBY5965172.1 heme lyase CcmF/NrfE family subunit [Qipengyuania flava]MBY6011496.1 heme lyase CcmF/NrfE family subunit [Qipengyuania flava]MBY6025938.1 heme lyase CcmF/NrfE family subunit [Qipengyuania flava]